MFKSITILFPIKKNEHQPRTFESPQSPTAATRKDPKMNWVDGEINEYIAAEVN